MSTYQEDKQIKEVEERLLQSVREREEQIENMRKTLQKEHEKQIKALKEQIILYKSKKITRNHWKYKVNSRWRGLENLKSS